MVFAVASANAQTTRLPGNYGVPQANTMVPSSASPVDIPQTNLTPIGPPAISAPPTSTTLGNPLFDPYNSGGVTGTYQPALPPGTLPPSPGFAGSNGGLIGGLFSQPASAPLGYPNYGSPAYPAPSAPPAYYGQPSVVSPPGATPWQTSPYGSPPGFATPTYPNNAFPTGMPSTLFPGGLFGAPGYGSDQYSAYRLLQGPRLRHTFINGGDSADDLNINTTDVAIPFAFPNFLYSNQPIYVVPSFSIHLWDGPSNTPAGLPGQAFDGFVDFNWQTDPNQMIGAELGVRVGVFSDFDAISSNSVRAMAKGLVSFRLTPASTLKGGVYYINREKVEFLPALGLLYQPNPYTRFDIYFPEPKLSRYWRTLGVYDVWGYIAGEYGGGVWTIQRADSKLDDTVDLYDYKVALGLEWGESNAIRVGRRTAFAELGYVFDRELIYENRGIGRTDHDLGDAFYVRVGIGY